MSSSSPPHEEPYILGNNDAEWKRLQLQHRLWKSTTDQLHQRAGFGPGQQLLDLGCGPGFTTLDLARLVGPTGEVIGRDLDARSLQHLEQLAAQESHVRMRSDHADAAAPIEADGGFDGIFSRWLLCWLPNPEAVLQRCAEVLLPGGKLALFDYLHYGGLELLPKTAAFRHGIDAVEARWRSTGGDPAIGNRLPRLCREAGFEVTHQETVVRSVRPTDELWQWPTTFFPGFMAKLVHDGDLSAEGAQGFHAAWRRAEDDPDGLFLTPPIQCLVARKRR